jgi:hypothetical protein
MNATEEIIVIGENLIECRISLFPRQIDVYNLQARAYTRGYKSGWVRSMIMGMAIIGAG